MAKNKKKHNSLKTDKKNIINIVNDVNSTNNKNKVKFKKIQMPKSTNVQASDLTNDQKHMVKKQIQHLHGHKFSQKRKLPGHCQSLELATKQMEEIAAKMQAKLAQINKK